MIKATNLSKIYYQGKAQIKAVGGVTLNIGRGESVLIAGPSGAGKSTLLHLLGGLDKPTSGVLIFDGTDFYGLPDAKRSRIRNKRIGFVFQFYHLLPEFSILENVMLPALMAKSEVFRGKSEIKERAKKLLGTVGLAERMNHAPAELSGGESQRAAIARSLVNFPEVLFCDEPTGNLDSEKSGEIIECLLRLKKTEGMALVVVSHDERLKEVFDKIYYMQDGIIKEERKKNEAQGLSEWQVCRQG